jgi:transcriptional regulator with XRE-family HTH domain
MSKRDIAQLMQERLRQSFARTGLSISEFSRRHHIDRSTLSQLLSSQQFRMPRADTVAALADALHVSCDWLLGLTEEQRFGIELIQSAVSLYDEELEQSESQWVRWHKEAGDAKIRYVTVTSIPHQLKNKNTILYEYESLLGRDDAQTYWDSGSFLEEIERRNRNYEVCGSLQMLEAFAKGDWIWSGYKTNLRKQQLLDMAQDLEALYPEYQLYLFDETKVITVPMVLFGTHKAVLNCNGNFIAFTRDIHIEFLNDIFKTMIKNTVIYPHQTVDFIRKMAQSL